MVKINMKKENLYVIIAMCVMALFFSIGFVSAVDWSPSGNVNLRSYYNMTNLNYVGPFILSGDIDANGYSINNATNITVGNATFANSTIFWAGVSDFNSTQIENSGQELNIKESWFTTLWNTIFGTKTTDDLTQGSTNLYDNQSWNESKADGIYIAQIEETNLNVNSSTFWSGVSSFISKWFYDDGDVLTFNETQLNNTISDREKNWTKLQNYPVACPAGTYVTQIDDSITCTSISASSYDNLTVTNLTTENINTTNIYAGQLYYGNAPGFLTAPATRPFTTNAEITVDVCASGCNYTLIQDALDVVPYMLRHNYEIAISAGTYDENLFVYPSVVADVLNPTEGAVEGLEFYGANMNTVFIKSIHVISSQGSQQPRFGKMTMTGNDPYSDENASIVIYGSNHPTIVSINFTNVSANYGIMAYGSSITVSAIDCGNDDLRACFLTKHDGGIVQRDGDITGSMTDYVFQSAGGGFSSFKGNEMFATGGISFAKTDNGLLLDSSNKRIYHYNAFPLGIDLESGSIQGINVDDEGLIGFWTFDEDSGNNVYDSSYEGIDGTLEGNSFREKFKFGKSVSLDGDDDYVNINYDYSSALNNSNEITMCGWAKLFNGSIDGQILRGGTSGANSYFISVSDTRMAVGLTINTTTSETNINHGLNASNWNFYCGTYDGFNITYYANAEVKNTKNLPGSLNIGNSQNLTLGARPAGTSQEINGSLDDIMLFNKSLSNSEISGLYLIGSSLRSAGQELRKTDESNLNVNSSTWWASVSGFVSKWFYNDGDNLALNETELNNSIDDRSPILNVNGSNYWDNMDNINLTQMEDNGGTLNILVSWFTTQWNAIFSTKTTDDLTEGSTNLYDNQSWNETRGNDLYSKLLIQSGISDKDLIAYWKAETLNDYSGNGHNVSSVEGALIGEGKFGDGFLGNGSGGSFQASSAVLPDETLTEYSSFAWAKSDTTGDTKTIWRSGASGAYSIGIILGNSNTFLCQLEINNTNYESSKTTGVNTSEWNQYGCVYNGTALIYYVNGETVGFNSVIQGVINISANALTIGARTGGGDGFINGSIDEILIYGRAIEGLEAKALYEKTFEFISSEAYHMKGTNLNLRDKITFLLGEIIDNLVDGWIRINGGLNVTENLNVIGNFTGNQIYGEIYYHNHTATELNFATDGQYYHMFMLNATHLNGFSVNNIGWLLNSSLMAQVDGLYEVRYSSIGDGQNNHVYYSAIFVNEERKENCDAHKKMTAGGDVVTMNGDCFIELNVYDNVSVRVTDFGGTGTGNYYGANLNIVRIGT